MSKVYTTTVETKAFVLKVHVAHDSVYQQSEEMGKRKPKRTKENRCTLLFPLGGGDSQKKVELPNFSTAKEFLENCFVRSYELSGLIPQEYLSDTPYCAGFFGVSIWPIGCDTPSPFPGRFPLGEHAKWRCNTPPPPKRGISVILA